METGRNDREKLDEAKKQVYLKGFTDGVLTVGPHAGKKVSHICSSILQINQMTCQKQ